MVVHPGFHHWDILTGLLVDIARCLPLTWDYFSPHGFYYATTVYVCQGEHRLILFNLLELALGGTTDGALLRGFPGYGIAADLTDRVGLILEVLSCPKDFKCLLE